MNMTKASDKVMSRVMKLLDKANHPTTPPHEAELARQHAERLMAQHMIDRMDLTVEEKSKVEQDEWDLRVGETGDDTFGRIMAELMREVLTHCGVRMNPRYTYPADENGHSDMGTRRFKVVGFPEDMAYAERIWYRIFMEFVSNINPKWSKDKSIPENAYALINAGFEWQQIVIMANQVGDERMPVSEMEKCSDYRSRNYGKMIPVKGNRPLIKGIQMLRAGYKQECERRGETAAYRKGANLRADSRNSFAQSFGSTIRQRLRVLRESTKEHVSDKDKFALAVISTKEQVDAEFYKLFPDFDPEVQRRKWAEQDFLAACRFAALPPQEQKRLIDEERRAQARWARASRTARASYGRPQRTDAAAWERGMNAANSVNLRDDGEVKNRAKKGIK
jgi:hypothetical protein